LTIVTRDDPYYRDIEPKGSCGGTAAGSSEITSLVIDGSVHNVFVYPETWLVLVTARLPDDALHVELTRHPELLQANGIASVTRIGDCLAPSTLASAVYSGHRYARELDEPDGADVAFRRERVTV
jgi:hypothetical protein